MNKIVFMILITTLSVNLFANEISYECNLTSHEGKFSFFIKNKSSKPVSEFIKVNDKLAIMGGIAKDVDDENYFWFARLNPSNLGTVYKNPRVTGDPEDYFKANFKDDQYYLHKAKKNENSSLGLHFNNNEGGYIAFNCSWGTYR